MAAVTAAASSASAMTGSAPISFNGTESGRRVSADTYPLAWLLIAASEGGSISLELRVAILRIRWSVGRAGCCAPAVSGHVARDDGRLLSCGTSAGLMPASRGEAYSALEIE